AKQKIVLFPYEGLPPINPAFLLLGDPQRVVDLSAYNLTSDVLQTILSLRLQDNPSFKDPYLPLQTGALFFRELLLSSNHLGPGLPIASLSHWGSLTSLRLAQNNLSYLPLDIRLLSKLKVLDLRFNQLSSLPREICCLTLLSGL